MEMKSTKVQTLGAGITIHYVLFGVLIQHSHEVIAARFTLRYCTTLHMKALHHTSHEGIAP